MVASKNFPSKEGELLTIKKMNELGFDSVIIEKIDENNYKIDILPTNSYEIFIAQQNSLII